MQILGSAVGLHGIGPTVIGAALIVAGGLSVLWTLRSERTRAVLASALYAILSAAPLAIWVVRNVLVAGEPFGERASSQVTLAENVNLAAETFANWFVPNAWESVFWLVLADPSMIS